MNGSEVGAQAGNFGEEEREILVCHARLDELLPETESN